MSDGFVPDDGFAPEEEAPQADAPGLAESIGRGFVRGGTLGFGDEFVGAARALGPTGGSGQDFANDAPIVEPVAGDTFAERYTAGRDEERTANRAAQEAHPKASLAANVVGGGALAAGLPAFLASKGLGLGARMVSGAKAAAPVGAAYGLGESEAETPAGQMFDTFVGGVGGAALGAAAPVAGQALRSVAGPASRWLREAAVNQGRKVLTGNSGTISVKRPLSPEAVRAALDEGAIRPFGTTQSAAERLGQSRETVGDLYGEIVAALEAKGVTGPNAVVLAQRLTKEADQIATQSLGSPAPAMYRNIALELQGLQQGMHGPVPGVPKVDVSEPLFHGSPVQGLALLQPQSTARTGQALGPGVYLTTAPNEAAGYAGASGAIYRANAPGALLDLTRPLAEQGHTAHAARSVLKSVGGGQSLIPESQQTGFDIYRELSAALGRDGAARALRSAGINGLSEGTKRVVFDPVAVTATDLLAARSAVENVGRLGLTQAENMKRTLQRAAQSEYVKEGQHSLGGEAKTDIARMLREAIEEEVKAQAQRAPQEAAAFEPVKQRLGSIIEASNAANQAAARQSRNRGISLTDTIAGAAGMSSAGVPGAAAMAMANKLGRTRGPATASWLADKLSGATAPLAGGQMSPATQQAAEGSTLPALVEWLRARYGLTPSMAGAEEGAAP